MRRFWLLLLVFVLPLQMSWAATHFCEDDVAAVATIGTSAYNKAHEHGETGGTGKKSDVKKSDQLADCCGAAHSCHGLHHLMGPTEACLPMAASDQVVAAGDAPSRCGYVATRVERPKWLAA